MDTIPKSDDNITNEYLNSVLKGFRKIVKVDVKIPKTHGAMSIVRKLFLTYDDTTSGLSPSTLISKQNMQASENHMNKKKEGSDIMRHGELYKREVMMNNYFNGRDFIPKIYYSNINENQDFIMVMQDCSVVSDVKEGDENTVQNLMSLDNALIAIRDIAIIHAEFYHQNDTTRWNVTRGILQGNYDPLMKEKGLESIPEFFHFMFYTINHVDFLECTEPEDFASYNKENLRKLAKEHVGEIWLDSYEYISKLDYESVGGFGKYDIPAKAKVIWESDKSVEDYWFDAFKSLIEDAPVTLVHGDFRADNMLIENGKMKLIDWQCTSLGCGMIDVMSLLYNSLSIDILVEHEELLLQEYVDVLHENGCNLLTLQDAKKWLGYSIWYVFRSMVHFAKFLKNASASTTVIGVQYEQLQKLFVRNVVTTLLGIYKYNFSE